MLKKINILKKWPKLYRQQYFVRFFLFDELKMTSHDSQSYPNDGRTILKKNMFRKSLDHMSSYLMI